MQKNLHALLKYKQTSQ